MIFFKNIPISIIPWHWYQLTLLPCQRPQVFTYGEKAGEPTYLLLQKTDNPWKYTGDGKTLKGNKTIEIVSIN